MRWMLAAVLVLVGLLAGGFGPESGQGAAKATEAGVGGGGGVGVLSFNIRYANSADGENAWAMRKGWVCEILRDERLGIIGVQEALRSQLNDIRAACPKLGEVGVGRDDGKEKGEYAAILYRTDRWSIEKSGTFWLSEKPEEPGSMSWKTACTRVCTWALLKEVAPREGKTARTIWLFNTHLDHQSAEARTNGVRLIASRIADMTREDRKRGVPVIVTGDFNAGEQDAATRWLTAPPEAASGAGTPPLGKLRDTYRAVHPAAQAEGKTAEPVGTFNDFDAKKTGGEKIDYVLVTPEVKVTHAWIDRRTREGRTPSDHWPVGAVLVWE